MRSISTILLLALATSAIASPINTLPLSTRDRIGRLRPDERRALASRLSVELAARSASHEGTPERDLLEREIVDLLENVRLGKALAPSAEERGAIEKRLFGFGDDDSSSGSYAPDFVDCPDRDDWITTSTGLSDAETSHVQTRLNPERFLSYLSSINLTASDLNLNLDSSSQTSATPHVALAFSGGGYRAMLNGGGGLTGTDARAQEAVDAGTAGIGMISSYIAGLSGGSWLVGSYLANNNASIPYLAANEWNLSSNLVVPSDGFFGTINYFTDLVSQVNDKSDEGFATQITDYWGLALGSHLFPYQFAVTETPNLTLSDTSVLPAEDVPYAIIIAAEREPGQIVVAENATVWEFSYDKFGTWGFGGGAGGNESNIAGAFFPTKYLGTNMTNGSPTDSSKCVTGFDNLGFVIGTSSTLFNGAYVQLAGNGSSDGVLESAIEDVLAEIGKNRDDVAQYPNPFRGYREDTNPIADLDQIVLVDPGETNQNIPFEPLLIPARDVDAILAFDASADTPYFWPNGSAPRTTYIRFKNLSDKLGVEPFMPEIPSENTFVNLGLNTRPTFFGCDNADTTNTTIPLVIYVPNYPWSAQSNTSSYQLQYETDQALALIYNGMRTLTLNNTISDWPTCLACAFADRAVYRNGGQRADVCQSCFNTWCWDGTTDDSDPETYAPTVGQPPSFLNVTATAAADPSEQSATDTSSGTLSVGGTSYGGLAAALLASVASGLIFL